MTDPVTIYHYPRCSKSRGALELLQERGVEARVVKYLETPPTEAEVLDLLDRLEGDPMDLVRTTEKAWRELGLKGKTLGREDVARVIAEHPRLLQRPVVVTGERAVIGRPPERVKALFD